jgi:hypothetical protein
MDPYDPATAPDPDRWLALEEDKRILRIASYHRRTKAALPNPQIHAALHAVVENQLAEGMQTVIETMERLQSEGLSRHDALHAVGSVLVKSLQALLQEGARAEFEVEAYFQQLRSLTADSWLTHGS